MCGRFSLIGPAERIAEHFQLDEIPVLHARYNIAPSQTVAAVGINRAARRRLTWLRWGLVPAWAKDPAVGQRMINARAETLARRPAFRDAFRRRRCLLPADGFFEWCGREAGRQPWYFTLRDGAPLGMAGLWARWRDADGATLDTVTVITCPANDLVGRVHARMPAILHPDDYAAWLDPDNDDPDALGALLRPFDEDAMRAHPVSRRVNRPENDDAGVIEAAE